MNAANDDDRPVSAKAVLELGFIAAALETALMESSLSASGFALIAFLADDKAVVLGNTASDVVQRHMRRIVAEWDARLVVPISDPVPLKVNTESERMQAAAEVKDCIDRLAKAQAAIAEYAAKNLTTHH